MSISPASPIEALLAGADRLGISLAAEQATALIAYLDLIAKWNRVYNLTAVRDPGEMLTHHLLDSMAVIAPLRRQTAERSLRLLDVGSGAGLPGIVIAICCPEISVDCVDTVAKKAAFINQVAATLKLPNLRGIHAHVEEMAGRYEVISSRAFSSLPDFTNLSRAVLAPGGVWLAMKGRRPEAELALLPDEVEVFHVEQLVVPDLQAERCIVWMRLRQG